MKRILLDTNAYSELAKGNAIVLNALDQTNSILLNTVVLAELLAGFKVGKYEKKNRLELENFIEKHNISITTISQETSETYSNIVKFLTKLGKPIPTNDIWIAASAIELNAKLVTFDKHFSIIKGLNLWKPKQ